MDEIRSHNASHNVISACAHCRLSACGAVPIPSLAIPPLPITKAMAHESKTIGIY